MPTSYEKTRKQYYGSKEDRENRKFEAGLVWYMKEKESIIKRIYPEFEGFGRDYKSNMSYEPFVDEYNKYLQTKNASSMGQQVTVFEAKYKEQINIKNLHK